MTMLLKGRLSPSRPPIVRLNGVLIRYVTQVKYLGVTMSERMCFTPHLVSLRERLQAIVGQVRRVVRFDWGLSRRAVRTVYRGLFVACATYGAAIWYESALKSVGKRHLMACQRIMLLACLPVCRTVSTDALQVLLGAPPLDLLVVQRAVAFRLRRRLCMPLRVGWLSDGDVGRGFLECKRLLNECMLRGWQNRWDNSSKGRVTYEYIRDVSFVGENPDFGFSLSLGFLLTGHGPLNAYLHERHLSTSEECVCGSAREDWVHVLCECPMYSDIRNLAGVGIRWTDGRYDVSGVIANRRNVEMLGQYACEVFRRRRNLRRSVD